MAGRALTFSNDKVIRLAREKMVPVVGDDWYQRRRRDAEGEFFRKMAAQRRGIPETPGGRTRQGMYVLTASGRLLGYRNNWDPNNMVRELGQAMAKWNALPQAERAPGAVRVPALAEAKLDPRFHRAPPANGMILRVHSRLLEKGPGEKLMTCSTLPSGILGLGAGRDHAWIQEAEWQQMVPREPAAGKVYPLPPKVVERISRWHLVDNTRGEPPFWSREQVREAKIQMRVTAVTKQRVTLALEGQVQLAT
ncbi:MAG: hypothetical protein OER86_07460, partial [Phycisphaerae bacterium]|nr:hypothetical protein [Phycisphaerae bacterium]